MKIFNKFILPWACRKIVKQGNHKFAISDFLKELCKASREEFTEDNPECLKSFLVQRLELAWEESGLSD